MALLLDEYAKDWRKSIGKQQGLAALLASAIAVKTTGDAILTARTLASGYDGEFVFAEEGERARKHAARLAQLQHEFVDGRVLRIVTSSALNYSFDPNAAEPLDSSRIVYTPLTVSDAWGTLEAPTGAMLVFASPMALIVPIPDGATAESVPWKLTLKPGYTLEAPREGAWRIVAATR